MNPVDQLSLLQRRILRRLLDLEVDNPEPAGEPRCIAVKDLRGPGPKTRASSATFSRAIRRLEKRGYLILCNLRHGIRSGPNTGKVTIAPTDKHVRADHLLLTKVGREIAACVALPPPQPKLEIPGCIASPPSQPKRVEPAPWENEMLKAVRELQRELHGAVPVSPAPQLKPVDPPTRVQELPGIPARIASSPPPPKPQEVQCVHCHQKTPSIGKRFCEDCVRKLKSLYGWPQFNGY